MPPVERDELIMALMKGIDSVNNPELWHETLEAFEKASDRELHDWYNQQHDPVQAEENAYVASAQIAEQDILHAARLEISDAERDEIMKEIADNLGDLERVLTQEQDHKQELEEEQEHEQ